MQVRIYVQSKSAMQSGRARVGRVRLDAIGKARGTEALMGWTSAPDTLGEIRLSFDTVEAAVAHAQKRGWTYTVDPVQERIVRPRNYTDNFKYLPPVDATTATKS